MFVIEYQAYVLSMYTHMAADPFWSSSFRITEVRICATVLSWHAHCWLGGDFTSALCSCSCDADFKSQVKAGKKVPAAKKAVQTTLTAATKSPVSTKAAATSSSSDATRDNSMRKFRRLCLDLEGEPSYLAKTKLIADFIKPGKGLLASYFE